MKLRNILLKRRKVNVNTLLEIAIRLQNRNIERKKKVIYTKNSN